MAPGEYGLAIREMQVLDPLRPSPPMAVRHRPGLVAGRGGCRAAAVAILVANMLNSLFTQQIPQIGIMKASAPGRAASDGTT